MDFSEDDSNLRLYFDVLNYSTIINEEKEDYEKFKYPFHVDGKYHGTGFYRIQCQPNRTFLVHAAETDGGQPPAKLCVGDREEDFNTQQLECKLTT